jgi:uncharacterized protein (TIGR00730 family)
MHTEDIVESSLVKLWDVIHDLEKLVPAGKDFFRVSVFGSSRVKPGDAVYEDVRRLARRLADMGCDIVTGGGPGLMEAANLGAREGNTRGVVKSFGLAIDLPLLEGKNLFLDESTLHYNFFSRLHHFVFLSSAFVAMPGGIGTLLEIVTIWQLLQVKKMTQRPLILVGDEYHGLIRWMEGYMVPRFANAPDLQLPRIVATVDEAVPVIEGSLKEFHARMRRGV